MIIPTFDNKQEDQEFFHLVKGGASPPLLSKGKNSWPSCLLSKVGMIIQKILIDIQKILIDIHKILIDIHKILITKILVFSATKGRRRLKCEIYLFVLAKFP